MTIVSLVVVPVYVSYKIKLSTIYQQKAYMTKNKYFLTFSLFYSYFVFFLPRCFFFVPRQNRTIFGSMLV